MVEVRKKQVWDCGMCCYWDFTGVCSGFHSVFVSCLQEKWEELDLEAERSWINSSASQNCCLSREWENGTGSCGCGTGGSLGRQSAPHIPWSFNPADGEAQMCGKTQDGTWIPYSKPSQICRWGCVLGIAVNIGFHAGWAGQLFCNQCLGKSGKTSMGFYPHCQLLLGNPFTHTLAGFLWNCWSVFLPTWSWNTKIFRWKLGVKKKNSYSTWDIFQENGSDPTAALIFLHYLQMQRFAAVQHSLIPNPTNPLGCRVFLRIWVLEL